ncbi:hypothetical protein QOZ80_3AG0221570 [Eleusine coracana subsp. coracana]|nr:hypothetical protein QOZ80_3AG0221570 [Eleusine coracana subsp. coracana]
MEGAFRLNMGIALCLNRKLPYGDKSSEMDFFEAAVEGNLDRLREMAKGKDAVGMARLANVCVGGAVGPLQAAVRLGRLDVVRCLVEELGFDINGGSKDCDITALASAALDEKLDTVRYLLDNGADPNKKDDPGSVPLHWHDEVARFLLSRGASVDIAYFHGTPLHIAAAYGKPNVMKVLLEHHADPDKVSEELGTPLVAALNATGADVNSTGPDTPLVVATALDLTGCIKYLLKAGGDPNITTDSDLLPIQIAACHGNRKVVEILFPFTAPIPIVSNWSVEGILAHVKAIHSKGKLAQNIFPCVPLSPMHINCIAPYFVSRRSYRCWVMLILF